MIAPNADVREFDVPAEFNTPVTLLLSNAQLEAILYSLAFGAMAIGEALLIPEELVPPEAKEGYLKAKRNAALIDDMGQALSHGAKIAKANPGLSQVHHLAHLDREFVPEGADREVIVNRFRNPDEATQADFAEAANQAREDEQPEDGPICGDRSGDF